MTIKQVAEYLGLTYGQTDYYINLYGLYRKNNNVSSGMQLDKELLHKYYLVDRLSFSELAENSTVVFKLLLIIGENMDFIVLQKTTILSITILFVLCILNS